MELSSINRNTSRDSTRNTASNINNKLKDVYFQYNILHIDNIDTIKEEYLVDFNVKIFWQMLEKELIEGRPLHNINETNYKSVPKSVWSDIWNPQIFFVNLSTQNFEERNYRIEKRDNKLYVVENIHMIGVFSQKFSLHNFPFDYQELEIIIQSKRNDTRVNLVPVHKGPKISAITRFTDIRQEWSLCDYTDYILEKTLSEHSNSGSSYPRVRIKFCIDRSAKYYIWNIIFVNFLIIALAFTSLTVDYNETGDRLNVTMILLLTTIAFKFATSESLPNVPYLTFLDKYIISGISFHSLVTVQNAVVSIVDNQERFEYISLLVLAGIFGLIHLCFGIKTYMIKKTKNKVLNDFSSTILFRSNTV